MTKILIKITFYILIASGLGWSGYTLYKSPLFILETINYSFNHDEGIERAYEVYIESLKPQVDFALVPFKGKSLWNLDIQEIESKLAALSWVKGVTISRRFPNQIYINIDTKKILANVLYSSTKVQPIAADFETLDAVEIAKAPLVPILAGKEFLKNEDLKTSALRLLQELPLEGAFSYDTVSEVYPFRNDEFKVLLKHPKAFVMINTENVPLKAARISKVIDYMDPQEMRGRVIDSNFSKKVLVRPRNHR